jgi:two-component system LytT family sensor kinase
VERLTALQGPQTAGLERLAASTWRSSWARFILGFAIRSRWQARRRRNVAQPLDFTRMSSPADANLATELSLGSLDHGSAAPPTASRRVIWLAVGAFWTAFGLLVAIHSYLAMLEHDHGPWRVVAYSLVVCAFWAAATPLVAACSRRYPLVPLRPGALAVHLLLAGGLCALHFGWQLVAIAQLLPCSESTGLSGIARHAWPALQARLPLELMVYCAILASIHAFEYHQRSQRTRLQAVDLERQVVQARLDALVAQLQPHFLFNGLHTIAGLIRAQQGPRAIEALSALSELLRYALDTSHAMHVALARELEISERYLSLERTRFSDRLEYRVEADPASLCARVPPLLLQPLVENAVRHGIAPSRQRGTIVLCARRRADQLVIEARNPCRTDAHPSRSGLGLRNTAQRLQQLYPDAHQFTCQRRGDEFVVVICIPWVISPAHGGA